jgi:hypothetical protein
LFAGFGETPLVSSLLSYFAFVFCFHLFEKNKKIQNKKFIKISIANHDVQGISFKQLDLLKDLMDKTFGSELKRYSEIKE